MNYRITKYLLITIALFLCLPVLKAQTLYNDEVNVGLGLGSSSLKYQTDQGASKSGFGWNFGAAYSHYFTKMIGVSLGLEAEMFGSSVDISTMSFNQQIPTPPGLSGNFSLAAKYEGFKETQSAIMFQIPVMLRLRFPVNEKSSLFLGTGIKAGFPVSSKWNQSITSLTTKGYSDFTMQYYEAMPNHGFSTYPNVSSSGKLTLSSPVLFTIEGGMKFNVAKAMDLYAGLFLDYGLNNVYKAPATNSAMLAYNSDSPADYNYNSILTSNHYSASGGIKPFAFGVTVKLGFGFGKAHEYVKKKNNTREQKTEPAGGWK